MRFRREEYFGADGSIKRLPRIDEVFPDGTRVLENGCKLRPSTIDLGGENGLERLDSMADTERNEWEEGLMQQIGRRMSELYAAQASGALNYK